MQFPFNGLTAINSSDAPADQGWSLFGRKPVVAAPYVGILGVAAVVGTFGNLVIITTVTVKHLLGRRHRSKTTNNDVGRAFIVNLALSDLIVTAVINPLAIAGRCAHCTVGLHYAILHRVGKKHPPKHIKITSLNTTRFSKFFHCYTLQSICNAAIIKKPTTSRTRRYTTL